jgi:hypothetical protein
MGREQLRVHAFVIGAVAFITVAAASVAVAQVRWGSSQQVPREGACFYQDANFRGQYFCLGPGQSLSQVPRGLNDRISSVRLYGNNTQVTVFSDRGFRGTSARFLTDVGNLSRQGWNDLVSSARVGTAAVRWTRNRAPAWGRQEMPREGACFYRDADFRGDYFCLPRGASYEQVPAGFNDSISSIRVRGANVMLFTDRGFEGRSSQMKSDVKNLRGAWSDRVSSIRVY